MQCHSGTVANERGWNDLRVECMLAALSAQFIPHKIHSRYIYTHLFTYHDLSQRARTDNKIWCAYAVSVCVRAREAEGEIHIERNAK